MRHSILIVHRDRNPYLAVCLWGLQRSAEATGRATDWEVVIVDNGSKVIPRPLCDRARVVVDKRRMPVFCKPALWNRAIDEAQGELLTFLDADMVVGSRFLEGVDVLLEDPSLMRLCYRVRNLRAQRFYEWLEIGDRRLACEADFGRYDSHDLAYEAWGVPWRARYDVSLQPWGNSQFTVRRQDIDSIRPDESYLGKGFEDLDWNCRQARAWGDRYRGLLREDPAYCFLHLGHTHDPDWIDQDRVEQNRRRFRRLKDELERVHG